MSIQLRLCERDVRFTHAKSFFPDTTFGHCVVLMESRSVRFSARSKINEKQIESENGLFSTFIQFSIKVPTSFSTTLCAGCGSALHKIFKLNLPTRWVRFCIQWKSPQSSFNNSFLLVRTRVLEVTLARKRNVPGNEKNLNQNLIIFRS